MGVPGHPLACVLACLVLFGAEVGDALLAAGAEPAVLQSGPTDSVSQWVKSAAESVVAPAHEPAAEPEPAAAPEPAAEPEPAIDLLGTQGGEKVQDKSKNKQGQGQAPTSAVQSAMPEGNTNAKAPFVVLMSGNLRTFRWTSKQIQPFLDADHRFEGRPYYLFLHTWDQIEHMEDSWWKQGVSEETMQAVQGVASSERTLEDPDMNPWVNNPQFFYKVETYDKSSIASPPDTEKATTTHVQHETRKRVFQFAQEKLQSMGVNLPPETVFIKTRPDATWLNCPTISEMEEVLRSNQQTIFSFTRKESNNKDGLVGDLWVSESMYATSAKSHTLLNQIDYVGMGQSVGNDVPEVNFGNLLKSVNIRPILDVTGITFCRVEWLNSGGQVAQGNEARTGLRKGHCMQHSDWDQDSSVKLKTPTLLSKPWVQVTGNGDPMVLTGDKMEGGADYPCFNDVGQDRITCGTVAALGSKGKTAKTSLNAETEAVPEHQAQDDWEAAILAMEPTENGLHVISEPDATTSVYFGARPE